MTKDQVIAYVAEQTALTKREAALVLDAYAKVIKLNLRDRGEFDLLGLLKITAVVRKPTPERQIPNPRKPGEKMTVAARPAGHTVRVRALKALKNFAY